MICFKVDCSSGGWPAACRSPSRDNDRTSDSIVVSNLVLCSSAYLRWADGVAIVACSPSPATPSFVNKSDNIYFVDYARWRNASKIKSGKVLLFLKGHSVSGSEDNQPVSQWLVYPYMIINIQSFDESIPYGENRAQLVKGTNKAQACPTS